MARHYFLAHDTKTNQAFLQPTTNFEAGGGGGA